MLMQHEMNKKIGITKPITEAYLQKSYVSQKTFFFFQ